MTLRNPSVIQPAENLHVHGKAISGHRHSHPLRDGESTTDPDHEHYHRSHDASWAYPDEFATVDDWLRWLGWGDT